MSAPTALPLQRQAPPALQFRDVHAGYGQIEVLHGVDLAVAKGSCFALLGPNGAGKSTVLKIANARLRPTQGTVEVAGSALRRPSPDRLARAGVCAVPETRGVFPNLSVLDNLRMWTYRGGVSRHDVEAAAFARFPRLKERRSQLAGTLSGGEQQMLAISRALVGAPSLLLLDEISMGLAPTIVEELYELVAGLRAEGVSVLLVEQFVTMALAIADRAAILVHGRIVKEGPPSEMADEVLGAYLLGGTPSN